MSRVSAGDSQRQTCSKSSKFYHQSWWKMGTIIFYRINLVLEEFDYDSRSEETTVGYGSCTTGWKGNWVPYVSIYQSLRLDKLEKILYKAHDVYTMLHCGVFLKQFLTWKCNNMFPCYCGWHRSSYQQYTSVQCCHGNATVSSLCKAVKL